MVRKIKGSFFLNREEVIEYLIKAYQLKWCVTTWHNQRIKISYCLKNSQRKYFFVNTYKIKNSQVVHFSQRDLDLGMLS
jgi:hypothetical protein